MTDSISLTRANLTMANSIEITVPANEDADDCLTDAAETYIATHLELKGWDLSPRWTVDETRETVTLTVPAWSLKSLDVTEHTIRALKTSLPKSEK